MRKYYQSVTVEITNSRFGGDEWIDYEGYDKEKALEITLYMRHDKYTRSETREYTLPDDRDFEELSDEEQCSVLSCYNVID